MLPIMARPLRIEYPGAYYHVMNRGLSRRHIFIENQKKGSKKGSSLGMTIYTYLLICYVAYHGSSTSN